MNAGNRDKLYIACFTDAGERLAERIAGVKKITRIPDSREGLTLSEWTKTYFAEGNALIFIGASGIAVRAIAPFVSDKTKDPAVLCMDEKGRFVIPLLSGHIGGANGIAEELAKSLGAQAVLTTATDVNDLFAIDVFADINGLIIDDMKVAKRFSAALLKEGEAYLLTDMSFPEGEVFIGQLPREVRVTGNHGERKNQDAPVFTISPFKTAHVDDVPFVRLIPQCVLVGIGCRRGKTAGELYAFLSDVTEEMKIDMRSVASLHSIDLKKYEPGMRELSERLKIPFYTYTTEILRDIKGEFSGSEFVERTTGVDNVCERAVRAGGGRLISKKAVRDGMTIAMGMIRPQ